MAQKSESNVALASGSTGFKGDLTAPAPKRRVYSHFREKFVEFEEVSCLFDNIGQDCDKSIPMERSLDRFQCKYHLVYIQNSNVSVSNESFHL